MQDSGIDQKLHDETIAKIQEQVSSNPTVIYMKGSPQLPSCGFSARAVQALINTGEKFAFVNVLADNAIYTFLPEYENWPTFPQIYINGKLQGGCDIVLELAESGELKKMMQQANQNNSAN